MSSATLSKFEVTLARPERGGDGIFLVVRVCGQCQTSSQLCKSSSGDVHSWPGFSVSVPELSTNAGFFIFEVYRKSTSSQDLLVGSCKLDVDGTFPTDPGGSKRWFASLRSGRHVIGQVSFDAGVVSSVKQVSTAPQRLALVVGINAYESPNQLHGCVGDAEMAESWLRESDAFGYKEKSESVEVVKLLDGQATGSAIGEALAGLVKRCRQPGDLLMFFYSGHGTTLDVDGVASQAICPVDLSWDFTSGKLHRMVMPAVSAGATVVLWMDCCHSGTMGTVPLAATTTALGVPKAKFLPPPEHLRPRDPDAPAHTFEAISRIACARRTLADKGAGQLVLLAGCQEDETSSDVPVGGEFHGAFTWCANVVLRENEWHVTNGDLVLGVKKGLRDLSMQLGIQLTQNPNLVPASASGMAFLAIPNVPRPASRRASVPAALVGRPALEKPNEKRDMSVALIRLWKDDPCPVSGPLGVLQEKAVTATALDSGPSDSQIAVRANVPLDEFGEFQPATEEDSEAVHAYGVVRLVIDMYERYIRAVKNDPAWVLQWSFGEGRQLRVVPRAGVDANAYYSRTDQSLKFFFFPLSPERSAEEDGAVYCFTVRSADIVAHETGHAILDSLQPHWLGGDDEDDVWAGALHESFADLTAIVSHLSQLDVCEQIITATRGDLAKDNALCLLAPQFGRDLLGKESLRNASNEFTIRMIGTDKLRAEIHDISLIMTGAVYGAMVDVFQAIKNPRLYDMAETLFRVGKKMRLIIMYAMCNGPAVKPTFGALALKMLECVETMSPKFSHADVWLRQLRGQFEFRGVLDEKLCVQQISRFRGSDILMASRCGTIKNRHRHHHHVRRQNRSHD